MTQNSGKILVLLSLLTLAGCGRDGPSDEEVTTAVRTIAQTFEFTLERTETIPIAATADFSSQGAFNHQVNFKGFLSPKEPLYEIVDKSQSKFRPSFGLFGSKHEEDASEENPPVLIKKVSDNSTKVKVLGRCLAEKIIDSWRLRCGFEDIDSFMGHMPAELSGKSRGDIAEAYNQSQVLELNSPEANDYFAKAAETKRQHEENIKRLTAKYAPYVSSNKTYEGKMTFYEHYHSSTTKRGVVNVKINFLSSDGKTVKAKITNLDEKKIEEYIDIENFWPKTDKLSLEQREEFPLIMKVTDGKCKMFDSLEIFQHTDTSANGIGFKFTDSKLIGMLKTDVAEYQFDTTLVSK